MLLKIQKLTFFSKVSNVKVQFSPSETALSSASNDDFTDFLTQCVRKILPETGNNLKAEIVACADVCLYTICVLIYARGNIVARPGYVWTIVLSLV